MCKVLASKCLRQTVEKNMCYEICNDFRLYGLPFHPVVVFRPEIDFLFKSASTYCAAAHDDDANPAAASLQISTALDDALYSPISLQKRSQ